MTSLAQITVEVSLTHAQREHAEWALDAMRDVAGEPDWYEESDLPRIEGDKLVFPTKAAIEDMLYRLEEQLPVMAEQDSVKNPRLQHASTVSAARRLAEKIREACK